MTTSQQVVRREDYQAPAFLVEKVSLDFDLDSERTALEGCLHLYRNAQAAAGDDTLCLHAGGQPVLGLWLDGRKLLTDEYDYDGRLLRLYGVPERFSLRFQTVLEPYQNSSLEGLYQSGRLLCTQCEPEGFRRLVFYPDRPDVMARFEVRLAADRERYPVLLSNGNQVAAGDLPEGRHFVRWQDPFPKPCYLFALVAGPLYCLSRPYRSVSGRQIDCRIYSEQPATERCAFALDALQRAMRWDEKVYGRECDVAVYMIVAIHDFNAGAMENKGLNLFNARYILTDSAIATDDDFLAVESVVAHEYFHNWTGNRITCRDWFQLSLKEGLTVFRDQCFSADSRCSVVKRIEDVRLLRSSQFAEDSSSMSHPVRPQSYMEINNFYTATVYEKGAEVVRLLHTLLGEKAFQKGMERYFTRHDGQAICCEELIRAVTEGSAVDADAFMIWYSQSGTPRLQIVGSYDATASRYTLHVQQQTLPTADQRHKKSLPMPLRVALLDQQGQPMRWKDPDGEWRQEAVLRFTDASQRFVFEQIESPPIPSLLRNFSAPVYLECSYSDTELALLAACDSDLFNRWEYGQQLALRCLLARLRGAEDSDAEEALLNAWSKLLRQPIKDPALLCECLSLPDEMWLSEQFQPVDPERVYQARKGLRDKLAHQLEQDFFALWQGIPSLADGFEHRRAGWRALRNQCLSYLLASGGVDYVILAQKQYFQSANMTDKLAAMRLLLHRQEGAAEQILEDFYRRWQDEPLVLDKWFRVQVSIPEKQGLERAVALLQHRSFRLTNPDQVYAVIGGMVYGNPRIFHLPSAEGYDFLQQQLLRLDAINPHVSARLAKGFSAWQRYEPKRRAAMQQRLQHLAQQENLSTGLYEVVQKALQPIAEASSAEEGQA